VTDLKSQEALFRIFSKKTGDFIGNYTK